MKINIYQAFYQIKMFKDLKKLITFSTKLDILTNLIMLFYLYKKAASLQYIINNAILNF